MHISTPQNVYKEIQNEKCKFLKLSQPHQDIIRINRLAKKHFHYSKNPFSHFAHKMMLSYMVSDNFLKFPFNPSIVHDLRIVRDNFRYLAFVKFLSTI